ncbi:MAG: ATP cone domain-containing protein, partial [Patescibacteria group bacterium]|nr:ATP cone domain-containing protein [Patescibacteria group bacterium]
MSHDTNIQVVKRSGETAPLDIQKIKKAINWACENTKVNPLVLETKSHLYFKDKVQTSDIQKTLIKTALNLI